MSSALNLFKILFFTFHFIITIFFSYVEFSQRSSCRTNFSIGTYQFRNTFKSFDFLILLRRRSSRQVNVHIYLIISNFWYNQINFSHRYDPEWSYGLNLNYDYSSVSSEPGVDVIVASYRDNVLSAVSLILFTIETIVCTNILITYFYSCKITIRQRKEKV